MTERLTCDHVRERELIERYAAGTLPEPDADALELHVLECQACWEDLEQALELQAALRRKTPRGAVVPRPVRSGRTTRREWRRFALGTLAAAAALVAAIFVWQRDGGSHDAEPPLLRGPEHVVVIATWQQDGGLRLAWAPVPAATLYRLRIVRKDGSPIVVQTAEPQVALPADEIRDAQGLMVELEAENALGEVVARSSLAPATPAR